MKQTIEFTISKSDPKTAKQDFRINVAKEIISKEFGKFVLSIVNPSEKQDDENYTVKAELLTLSIQQWENIKSELRKLKFNRHLAPELHQNIDKIIDSIENA